MTFLTFLKYSGSNIINDDKNKAGSNTKQRDTARDENEMKQFSTEWETNIYLMMMRSDLHTPAWRATYSLTASSLIRHTQHLLPWSPARPISISQLSLSLCLSFMSCPSAAWSMCSSPLLYLCLSINYETEALTNTVNSLKIYIISVRRQTKYNRDR